jgi:NAD(P)H-hydrate epimerase
VYVHQSIAAPLTVLQNRMVDEIAIHRFGMLGLVLMENAGRGAADFIADIVNDQAKIVVVCGTGNNGGDGLVIARHLHARGLSVSVWIIGDRHKMTADTAANLAILENTSVPCRWLPASSDAVKITTTMQQAIDELQSATLLVDAMLGTGSKGELRGTFAQMVHHANRSAAIRVAIDVPTGLDAQTGGHSVETLRAHHTLTFVASKVGLMESDAAPFVGELHILPIGIPPEVLEIVKHGSS